MADHTIRIVVVSTGAQQAATDIKSIGDAGKDSTSSLLQVTQILRNLGIGLGIGILIRQFASLSDQFIIFKDRVALATNSQAEQQSVMAQLITVSEQTGQSLDQVGKAYEQLKIATQGLGTSSDDVVGIVLNLSQAFEASGASAGSAAAIIGQLTVALDQGQLSGRQFRTLILNQTFLVDTLAKSIGLTVDRFRDLGTRGKLTAELLKDAFEIAGPAIQQKIDAAGIELTNARQFEAVRTRASEGANLSDNAVLGTLFKIVNTIGDELDKTVVILKKSDPVYGGAPLKTSDITTLADLGSAEKLENTLKRISILALSIKGISGLNAIDKPITADQTVFLDNMKERLVLQGKLNAAVLTQGTIAEAVQKVDDALLQKQFISRSEAERRITEDGETAASLTASGFTIISDKIKNEITDQAQLNAEEALQATIVNQIGGNVGKLKDQIAAIKGIGTDKGGPSSEDIFGISEGQLSRIQTALTQQAQDKQRIAQLSVLTSDASAKAEIALIKLQETSGKLSDDQYVKDEEYLTNKYTDEQKIAELSIHTDDAHSKALIQLIQLQQTSGKLSKEDAQTTLDSLTAQITLQQELAQLSVKTDATAGAKRAFLELQDTATDTSKQVETTITDTFKGGEDAIIQFVQTGKLSFSSLVDSILADLTRLLVQQAIEAPILSLLGGGSGNSGGLLAGLLPHAAGGPVTAGTTYLVGERGPELLRIGGGNGSVTPAGNFGGTPQVHLNVVNVSDPNEVNAQLANPNVQDTMINVLRKNRTAVKQALGIS